MNECIGVQCEEYPLLLENRDVRQEIARLREELGRHKCCAERIKDNDGMTKFYT